MTPDQVADVLGTAASAGVLLLLGLVGLRVVAPSRFTTLQASVAGSGPALGALVAVLAMLGSLWFSEGAHFPPCEWCWYQRIAMYPQVVLLGIAWFRRDEAIRTYVLALAVIGACISSFHILVERFPWIEGSGGVCDPANPCTIRWVEELGFITIPTMALSAFVLIALLMSHLPSGGHLGDGANASDEPSTPEPIPSEAP